MTHLASRLLKWWIINRWEDAEFSSASKPADSLLSGEVWERSEFESNRIRLVLLLCVLAIVFIYKQKRTAAHP